MMSDRVTPPAGPRTLAKAGLGLFFGAILFVVVAMVVWPALERARQPSVRPRANVVNKTSATVVAYAVDAGGRGAYTVRVGAGDRAQLVLAIGEASTEVDTRTIHLLLLDERGVELARTTFSGQQSHYVKTIEVDDRSFVLLGHDGKKLKFPEEAR